MAVNMIMSGRGKDRGSVPPTAVLEDWLGTLAGVSVAPARLLAMLHGKPSRVYGSGPLPGRPIPLATRDSAAALTSVISGIRLASACGPASAWEFQSDGESSVIFFAAQIGRTRVRRGDQAVTLDPGEACLVTDDDRVVIEGIDEVGTLLTAVIPGHQLGAVHAQLDPRGVQRLGASPAVGAAVAFMGSLLISSVTQDEPTGADGGDIIVSIVSNLAEQALASGRGRTRAVDVRQAALRSIERNHRSAAFGVEDIAAQLYISRRQLYRAFPDAGGIADMIARRRIQTAERLMVEQPSLQLTEISARSGFTSPGVMRSHFRRVHATTPQQHRLALRRSYECGHHDA